MSNEILVSLAQQINSEPVTVWTTYRSGQREVDCWPSAEAWREFYRYGRQPTFACILRPVRDADGWSVVSLEVLSGDERRPEHAAAWAWAKDNLLPQDASTDAESLHLLPTQR
jgi:hypothetical protein